MKINILLLTLLMLVACKPENPEQESSGKIFPYEISQQSFPNGLNLVTVPYESPGIVSFYIIVRAGSREEIEPGKTGFAHFFEHMMFRGTEKYPNEKYDATLKSIGAAANANTWLDRTVYHMTGNAEMLEKMFEIESDRFFNLKYSVHDFKTEAGAVKGEYTKNYASPFMQLNEKTMATAFEEHTYQHTTMGFWEDVVDMPNQYDYSLEFFDRFYKPEYTTILVVGDVTHERTTELTEKYFGNWKKGNYIPQIPVEPEQSETRFAHVQNGNFPPYISLNYKTPAFDPGIRDNAALQVISEILFSQRSDLYKKLVIDEGIARNLGSNYLFTRDPYLFSVSATLKKAEDLQYTKDQIESAINGLVNNGIDEKVLEETKSHILYSFATSLNSASSIAQSLSYMIWVTGDPEALNQYYQQINELTVADVQEIARKYLVPGRLIISTISPEEKGGVS
jgi:zinc protease